jgi:hypothetical protein
MFFRKYKIFPQIKNAVVDGKRMKDREKKSLESFYQSEFSI